MAGAMALAWAVGVQIGAAPAPLPGGVQFAANGRDPVPEGSPKVTTALPRPTEGSRHAALR